MKLLDTTVVVDIDRGGVADRVAKLDDEGRHAISAVTVTELQLGVNKQYDPASGAHADASEALERLLARFDIQPISKAIATTAADIIHALRQQGHPLHDLHDVYIGATARTNGLPVVTATVSHFDRIDGIDVIHWDTIGDG